MTITPGTDGVNIGGGKELTVSSKAITGGTLFITTLRGSEAGQRGVSTVFVPSISAGVAKLTAINVAGPATLSVGDITGASIVSLVSTNAAPGALTVRTAAQMLADTPGAIVGTGYRLRITNTGAGTLTLTADGGATVTLTGTMTVPTNTFRDFIVTFNTSTTATIRSDGTGTYS